VKRRHDPLANPEPLLKRVYAYVAYRVSDRSEAEDITSDTFERALRYRDSFDAQRGDPVAWLLGIARNCIYDARLRPRPIPAEPEERRGDAIDERVAVRVDLARALAALSDRDRELLALRYGADLRPREIAELLDQRTNAVEVALTRARTRLAAALDQDQATCKDPASAPVLQTEPADPTPEPT
jgi:RNA polymerase sigma-70 factor (ECF subfamily)